MQPTNHVRFLLLPLLLLGSPALAQNSDQTVWKQRDSPEAQAAAAKAFLNELALDGTIRMPRLLTATDLVKAGKSQEAFDGYLEYFCKRLRSPEYFGISEALTEGENPPAPQDRTAVLAAADKLMQNKISGNKTEIDLGEPGSIDWTTPWEPADTPRPTTAPFHTAITFAPLAQAYMLTGDKKYLDKWVAFLDDWSLNDTYFKTLHPLNVPDGINSSSLPAFRNFLNTIGRLRPTDDGRCPVPNRVLAQVLSKYLYEVVPCHLTYIRSNTHNWTPSASFIQVARLFEDFKIASFYLREGRRRNIEDQVATQNLRDGSENQQDHWYNAQFLKVSDALNLLEKDSVAPGWQELRNDTDWKAYLREQLRDRTTYLIHDRSPQNQLPLAWNGGYRRLPERGTYLVAPSAYEDPVNRAILDAVNGGDADPGYTSEWFPYSGFNLVRDGWTADSGYASMFCSPQPGAYGAFRSRSNNNTFCMNAYGQDLLMDDSLGHYMYPSSPIKVDGRDQFFHAGIYKVQDPAAHKVFQVNAWWNPANWRWHASDNFNLMEGVYAGPFANLSDAPKVQGPYGQDESAQGTLPLSAGIRDVTHQRMALYLRNQKLWIITDRMLSPGTHKYQQNWLIPIRPEGVAFDPDKINIDQTARKVWTNEPTVGDEKKPVKKVNLSLYQFSSAALTYKATPNPRKVEYGRVLNYGWDKIETSWQGTGNQQVITLAYPRAPGTGPEGDLKSAKNLTSGQGGYGFEAVTPDGTTVSYLASTVENDKLAIGNIAAQAGVLLVTAGRGTVLNCSTFSIGGKVAAIPGPDFEFDATGAEVKFTPIYRPIDPVTIGPDRSGFTGSQAITLSSKTPGVQFRYTLDGSDPTPSSKLYAGPFTISRSVIVKARAYRPGVTENPKQTSGTHATPVTRAEFTKLDPTPPLLRPRPNAGLQGKYYEGDWNQLLMNLDDAKPVAAGNVTKMWDTGLIPSTNPVVTGTNGPRSKYYALEYSGFLNVPEDGIYTLQAPKEFIWPATEAGYELKVWLGNKIGTGVFAGRVVGVNEWYPGTSIHGFGTWSVALQKGLQPFRVIFIDLRTDAAKKLNKTGLTEYIWSGTTPDLRISGPGLDGYQPIPDSWLLRPMGS